MPICADDRATNGVPFVFIYSAIFKRLKLCLPFTFFEKELMMELNVAPCQRLRGRIPLLLRSEEPWGQVLG